MSSNHQLFAMVLILLLFVIHCLFVHAENQCPLSSVMNLTDNFCYPVDIYSTTNLSTKVPKHTFPCYSSRGKIERQEFSCSSVERYCPIHNINVKDASKRTPESNYFCHFKRKLYDFNESIRFFALGGSVTIGARSQWCTPSDGPELRHSHTRCSWFYHFGEWIKRFSSARVEYHNLARGGYNSYTSSIHLSHLMKMNQISDFTSNDIIFLDHSCNDVEQLSTIVARHVESLIRRIFALSINNSWPSIVLLDANPLRFNSIYPEVYTNMSGYYKLPMWSYREAVLSSNMRVHQSQFAHDVAFAHNYMNVKSSIIDIHPPWHVHLFMADLYSAIFTQILEKCSLSQVVDAERMHTSPLILPPAKMVGHSLHCKRDNSSEYLSLSYEEVQKGLAIGSYSISNNGTRNSWSLREDGHRRGKGGFIIELDENFSTSAASLDSRDQRSVLSFTLTKTTDAFRTYDGRMLVQVMYFRTYENAGSVSVYFCGSRVARLNALWDDPQSNRMSIPEWTMIKQNMSACYAKNYSYPVIEFHPLYDGVDSSMKYVVGNYKFKLLGIKVCFEAST